MTSNIRPDVKRKYIQRLIRLEVADTHVRHLLRRHNFCCCEWESGVLIGKPGFRKA